MASSRRHSVDEDDDDDRLQRRRTRDADFGPDEPLDEDRPRKKKKKKRKKKATQTTVILALAGAALVLVVVLLVVVLKSGPANNSKNPDKPAAKAKNPEPVDNAPEWKTDPAMAEKLGAAVPIGRYRFTPPAEYVRIVDFKDIDGQQPPLPPGSQRLGWHGKGPREEEIPVIILVTVISLPPNQFVSSLEKQNELEIAEARKRTPQNWSQKPPIRGKLGGLTFMRTEYSATLKGFNFKSAALIAIDDRTVIFIEYSCAEGVDQDWALRLNEAAAHSFRKVP